MGRVRIRPPPDGGEAWARRLRLGGSFEASLSPLQSIVATYAYPTVKDKNDTSLTSAYAIYGTNWLAQTFTASGNYTISHLDLRLYKSAAPAGNFTVSIRDTDGAGAPTGGDLAVVNVLASSIGSEAWYSFILSLAVTAGTKYAIVCRCIAGDSTNRIVWTMSINNNYVNGMLYPSTNSGATWPWPVMSDYDAGFKTFGK